MPVESSIAMSREVLLQSSCPLCQGEIVERVHGRWCPRCRGWLILVDIAGMTFNKYVHLYQGGVG